MTQDELPATLERVARQAADMLRAQRVLAMTVYELAEAIGYAVRDDLGDDALLERARWVLERIANVRSGCEPHRFERDIRGSA